MISVVIPAYNAEAFIRPCLDSLLAQTYANWEAWVVDDSSTDASPDIIKEYVRADSRIKVLKCGHQGQATARNLGIEAATGNWLAFLDADDCFHPETFAVMRCLAEEYGLDVVSVDRFPGKGEPRWQPLPRHPHVTVLNGDQALEDMLYQKRVSSAVCDKLIRASLVKAYPFEPGLYYEDLDMMARLLPHAHRVGYSPLPLNFYRMHPASFVHVFSERRLDVLSVTEHIEERAASPRQLAAALDRRFAANYNMLILCAKEHHGRIDECWQQVKRLRRSVLTNPHSRLKNKLGALLSYLGRPITLLLTTPFY